MVTHFVRRVALQAISDAPGVASQAIGDAPGVALQALGDQRSVALQTSGGGPSAVVVGAVALLVGLGVGVVASRLVGGDDGPDASVRRLANELGVQPDARALQERVGALTDATDDVLRAAADEGVVDTSQERVDAMETLAAGVSRGRVDVVQGDRAGAARSGPTGGPGDAVEGSSDAVGGPGDAGGGADDAVVARAATAVRSSRSPRSPTAGTLLDVLEDDRVDERLVRDAIEDVVDELEAVDGVTRAAERVGDVTVPAQAEAFADRLADVDGPLSRTLEPVAADLVSLAAEQDAARSTRSSADAVLADLADAVERESTVALSGSTAVDRGQSLADRVDAGDVAVGSGDGTVADAAATVAARATPESAAATGLVDALREPTAVPSGRLEGALTTAVGALDEHARTTAVVDDVDADDVISAGNAVKRDLDPANDVEGTLLERVATLVEDVDSTGKGEGLQRFAAHRELVFYRDTLVPTLEAARDDPTTDASARDMVETVRERIDAVEAYYERREDHNHTIPRHFVTLARSLHEDGRQLADTQPERARGVLSATEALLDHVEDLYERNQYSIMLRRLRG